MKTQILLNLLLVTGVLVGAGACQPSSERLTAAPFQAKDDTEFLGEGENDGDVATFVATKTAVPTVTLNSTPTQLPTTTPTTVPSPKSTLEPTPAPIFEPFEAPLSPESVAYPLPLAREGDIAIYFHNSRLVAANVIDVQLPESLWESEPFGEVLGAITNDDYLYIWSGATLTVWNIKDTQNPTQVSSLLLTTSSQVPRVEVSTDDDRLYLLQAIRDEGTLTTVDIALPESPSLLGTANFRLPAFHPYMISKNHLYVVDEGIIDIFDLSNPVQPSPVAQIPVSTNINSSLSIQDHLLFVTTSSRLFVFDISNLSGPVPLAAHDNTLINQMIILDGTALLYLEICGWEPRDDGTVSGGCGYLLDVVDIENPAQPLLRGTFTLNFDTNQEMVHHIHLLDPYLYFEMSDGRLYILELNKTGLIGHNE